MDGQTVLQIVVSVITVLGGSGTVFALFRIRAERQHLQAQTETARADAAEKLVRTSLELLKPVEVRTQDLEKQLTRVRQESEESLARARRRVQELEEKIRLVTNTLEEERYRSQREINRLNAQLQEREGLVDQLAFTNEELSNIKEELARIKIEYETYRQRNPENPQA